jgi:hypothetical protein
LLAAHAAEEWGHDVVVYSRRQRSDIHGAQYIHESIPRLCEEADAQPVSYGKIGEASGYAAKVYLDPEHPTSWDKFPVGVVPAWPMTGVYATLWSRWESRIVPTVITPDWIRNVMLSDGGRLAPDVMFNSLPRNLLCEQTVAGPDELAHQFQSAPVVFEPDAKLGGENYILYNGKTDDDWYRTSRLFGHSWTEYSASLFVGEALRPGWLVGIKPTHTDCDCLNDERMIRIGRFGRWEKATLVTDAYRQAVARFEREKVLAR